MASVWPKNTVRRSKPEYGAKLSRRDLLASSVRFYLSSFYRPFVFTDILDTIPKSSNAQLHAHEHGHKWHGLLQRLGN
jgi:hypothetical protein